MYQMQVACCIRSLSAKKRSWSTYAAIIPEFSYLSCGLKMQVYYYRITLNTNRL